MNTPWFKRSGGGRGRWYLALSGLLAVGVTGAQLAGMGPASATPADDANTCINGSTATLSFPSSTATAGVPQVITWTANLPGPCGTVQAMLSLHMRDVDGADLLGPPIALPSTSGSHTITMAIPAGVDALVDADGTVHPNSHPDNWTIELNTLPVGNAQAWSRRIAAQSVTVDDPAPLASGSTVNITGNAGTQRTLLMRALATPNATINVAGNVDMDLTGIGNIVVAGGVKLIGDRSVNPAGPRFFTTTFARRMFTIAQDNVRISGLRMDGGEGDDASLFAGMEFDEDCIAIFGAQHVEIDHNELTHWHGAAVTVTDPGADPATGEGPNSRLNRSNYDSVHVHDNYIHENQHPTASGLSTSGHGAGYGVAVAHGAYALIDRNVFNDNRHAITAGGEFGTGYYARDNLFLRPGIDRLTAGSPSYNHQIDVHGQGTCGKIGPFGEDYNCGYAGQYFDVRYNTVADTESDAVQLRGMPTDPQRMVAQGNAFAQSLDHALTFTLISITDLGNTYGASAWNDTSKSCDFDGDGAADEFHASGAGWWYYSSQIGRYVFLQESTVLTAGVTLADYDGDHRCDVSAGGQIYYNPDPVLRPRPVATLATVVGSPVSTDLIASGGTAPYTWTVTGLPAGLSANSAGHISGTPALSGVSGYTVSATVSDAGHQTKSFTFPATLQIQVPNVFSYDQASAIHQLGVYGLPATTATVSDCWSSGDVENQSPSAGTAVAPGTTVRLTISTCPPPPPGHDGSPPQEK